jgi:iron complex outermembrane receptor protein
MRKHALCGKTSVVAAIGFLGFGVPTASFAAEARTPANADRPQSAAAKPIQPAPADASAASDGQDIIVTAQRRAEKIQDVPISIVAVSGDTLVKAGAVNLTDLQRMTPGLKIAAVGGFVSYTYIRGGGTNQIDPGSDPSVAYFVDDVYVTGNEGLQFDLFDIDHVEVLKGPQGILFGRNAASGAISVVTKRPTATVQGSVDLEYGSFNAALARGTVSGPLTDGGNLLGRISIAYRRRDPITRNLTGGGDPGKIDAGGVRGQLEWRGTDITMLLSGSYYKARNGQTNLYLSTPDVSGFVDPSLPQRAGQSPYVHYYDFVGYEHQDTYDLTGRLEWQTPIGQLTSISAYRSNLFNRAQDNDGTVYDASRQISREKSRSFSQEVRLVGDVSTRLHYIAGLYYYHSAIDFLYNAPRGPAFPTAAQRGQTITDASTYLTDSYAAFGQATFDFTDQLDLTIGGRFTQDDKEDRRNVSRLGTIYSVDPNASFHAFTPAVTLNIKPRRGLLVYLSYRKGYKSGGFQSLAPTTAAIANTPFLPEYVASYEAGLKVDLFDNKVQASAALFRSDIRNQQISRLLPTVSAILIDNAGRTRADGVDLALTVKPVPGLTLAANATFQKARFRDYQNGAVNYAGNAQLRSPDFTGYFSADYRIPLGRLSSVTLHGDYSRTSSTYFDAPNSNTAGLYQPTYGIGNLRVTWSPQKTLDLSGFIRNVGNTLYFQNIAIGGKSGAAVPNDPRTYGVALNLRF